MSVVTNSSKCTGCGSCVDICPGNLLCAMTGGMSSMRDNAAADCWDCMACVKACPNGALTTRLPYSLADYTATLHPRVFEDRIVWTCRDMDGHQEEFEQRTLDF